MNTWELPLSVDIGGRACRIQTDYRDILKILRILADERYHPRARWLWAVTAFLCTETPPMEHFEAACDCLARFLQGGETPGVCQDSPLIDWETDAPEILDGVNAAAGHDIRRDEYLHWWTFLSFFNNIREGRLADLVAIRRKRKKGAHLTPEEQEYIRRFPHKFRPKETEEDKKHREKLEAMLRAAEG